MNPEETFGRGGLNEYVDVDKLVDNVGLDDEEIAWRKDFVGFDDSDAERLSALEPLLQENSDRIADDFYDNLLAHDAAQEIVDRSPKDVEALKETQRAYLVSLAGGDYDRRYFQQRARIGKLHELLDMPLKHYIGQYGVYYDLLLEQLNERIQQQVVDAVEDWAAEQDEAGGLGGLANALGFGGETEQAGLEAGFEATIREAIDDGLMDVLALLRIVNLDMQVAADTYVDAYAQRLERAIERQQRLAESVETDVQGPIGELHEASQVVAERAETISDHTSTQAVAVDDVAGELGEVSAAVEEIASAAAEVHDESERTERLAAAGVESADETVAELEAIEAATDRAAEAATRLEDRTDEIDAALERLEDVAERTAILAKNAKIEASRSTGEQAGPMAVIADEVQSFATQTRTDVEAIETAVRAVREAADETAAATGEAAERVDQGTDRVRETMGSLEAIHESASETAASVEDVATATDQQARTVERAATTVDEIAETADQVASAAESVAAASQEQTASLAAVDETVSRLTDDDGDVSAMYAGPVENLEL